MAGVVSATASAPLAQTPAIPAFEVASIKPIKCCEPLPFAMTFQPGGRFRAKAVTSHRTSGGPKWIDVDRFDIEAKAETDFPRSPSGPTRDVFVDTGRSSPTASS
jgi:hypothetical protein